MGPDVTKMSYVAPFMLFTKSPENYIMVVWSAGSGKNFSERHLLMINIAVDGGGSKLLAVAFDEEPKLLCSAVGGAVNGLFTSKDTVENAMFQTAKDLHLGLWDIGEDSRTVENLYITIAGSCDDFIKELSRYYNIKNIHRLSEGVLGMYAGALGPDGLLVLAGTGSDCFYNENGETVGFLGGWGDIFGDEGSGFYIGRLAVVAAIKSYDGRGKKTLLEKYVFEQLGLKNSLWEITRLYGSPNMRREVAALTRSVEKACNEGDEIALGIVREAAEEMALTAVTLLKKMGKTADCGDVFTTAGGAWKTSPLMTEHMTEEVKKVFPNLRFIRPELEPVIGGVVNFISDKGETPNLEALKKAFPRFVLKH